MRELKIDPKLKDLMPPLAKEEYEKLEKNIVENGFDKNFPIMEWNGYIADGHNRYKICKEHNVNNYTVGTFAYKTKEEIMEWMTDIQLGRRNLSAIQRISVAEKYRPVYKKQAKENVSLGDGDKKSGLSKLTNPITTNEKINVRNKLAKMANISLDTYAKGKKYLIPVTMKLKRKSHRAI